MEKLFARFNVGRWIVDCPICSAATKVKIGDEMVFCGSRKCHPDKLAKKIQQRPNGGWTFVSDKKKQDRAKNRAYAMGEVYEVVFPDDAKSAETVLRKRKTEHQNYFPDREDIHDLEEENKSHKKLKYLWDEEENKKHEKEIKEKEKKVIPAELSKKELRRIK